MKNTLILLLCLLFGGCSNKYEYQAFCDERTHAWMNGKGLTYWSKCPSCGCHNINAENKQTTFPTSVKVVTP